MMVVLSQSLGMVYYAAIDTIRYSRYNVISSPQERKGNLSEDGSPIKNEVFIKFPSKDTIKVPPEFNTQYFSLH